MIDVLGMMEGEGNELRGVSFVSVGGWLVGGVAVITTNFSAARATRNTQQTAKKLTHGEEAGS